MEEFFSDNRYSIAFKCRVGYIIFSKIASEKAVLDEIKQLGSEALTSGNLAKWANL